MATTEACMSKSAVTLLGAAGAVLGMSLAVFSQEKPEAPKPNLEAGRKTYLAKCVMCHSKNAQGSKPLGVPMFNDPQVVKQFDTLDKFKTAVTQGVPKKQANKVAMPAYAATLKANEIEDAAALAFLLQTGRKTYAAKCLMCHGEEGKGNAALGVRAFNDPQVIAEHGTADTLRQATLAGIEKGEGQKVAMPAYEGQLKPNEIDGLVWYMLQIQQPEKKPGEK